MIEVQQSIGMDGISSLTNQQQQQSISHQTYACIESFIIAAASSSSSVRHQTLVEVELVTQLFNLFTKQINKQQEEEEEADGSVQFS